MRHFRSSSPTQDSGQHSADNLQLPLENGTLSCKPQINISEEVNRTTIWKQVNNCNVLFTKKQPNRSQQKYHKQLNPPTITGNLSNQNTNEKTQQQPQLLSETKSKKTSEIDKRLSTMREEEETNSDDANHRQLNHQKRTQV
ncbi:hypothetical protein RP20_CCG009706 [Aedes albopictus]|nr:hypothetical protein RP20_CCG009706 [Aedes albopictus]